MKSIAVVVLFIATALAVPTGGDGGGGGSPYVACPSGLYNTQQCCSTDLLGILDFDCNTPTSAFTSALGFSGVCVANGGKRARCCTVPVLGQAVLCVTPVGVTV